MSLEKVFHGKNGNFYVFVHLIIFYIYIFTFNDFF